MTLETTWRLRLPEDRERVAEGFRNVLGNHAEMFEVEYRIHRPSDGEIRWISGRAYPVRDEVGNVFRIVGIAPPKRYSRTPGARSGAPYR